MGSKPRKSPPQSRLEQDVRRLVDEMGWEGLEDAIDDWDGEDVDALRGVLDEAQFQALLDVLVERGHER